MEKIKIKQLISLDNKRSVTLIFAAILIILYSLSGLYQIGSIRYLPINEFEMSIPFIIESIWVYVALYPFLLISAFSYNDEKNFNKVLVSFMIVLIVSLLFFQFLPVAYPREFYPLPRYYDPSVNLFNSIRRLDTPLNCFPSLHVSLCFLFSFFHWDESKQYFIFSMVISIVISISTLTTKQHYIADIVSGFILALSVFLFIRNFTQITESHELKS